ncbi:MAG: slipin family protein [Gemmatimonadota bacterium]|jgi:regulator of protease activity HflC (stomatin/prohibitin superfamily)
MVEVLVPIGIGLIALLWSSLKVLREYERGVVFRLGRLKGAKGPGLIFLVPLGIDRMVKVPLRIVALDIPPQDVITRDNVSVKVNAVVYFRVSDPVRAVMEIEDYLFATSQLAQTTLRSVIGQAELDQLLAERERFNELLRKIIDEGTHAWGIEVTAVEVKDIDLPQEMKRAMARQAEAERERRAKVIAAEGELQASEKLAEAAAVIGREPAALQLRFLQTVGEIATENNSTTILPVPIDLFAPYVRQIVGGAGAAEGSATKSSSAEGRALLGAPPAIPGAPGTNLDPQRVEAAREKPQPR